MTTIDAVIGITKYVAEIAEVGMRTCLSFRISALFTIEEMDHIIEKLKIWSDATDLILNELNDIIDPQNGLPLLEVQEQAERLNLTMEINAKLAKEFESRFQLLSLQREEDAEKLGEVERLFEDDPAGNRNIIDI